MTSGRQHATGSESGVLAGGGQPGLTAPGRPGTVSKRTAAAFLARLRTPVPDPATGDTAVHPGRRRAVLGHFVLLACFIGAGIGVTWPVTPRLASGQLPWNADVASYVWALWWVAHQVAHLGNPFATTYMAAPVGIQLGFDTL
ncbi:MAG: hypothetical protein ACRDPO_21375, partial [Streptosporangiaceae bacterium]